VCQNDEGDRPVYITPRSNDINWCMGAKSQAYNSTVAIVLGVATE
jgi:methylamine dehydrogenase light chain